MGANVTIGDFIEWIDYHLNRTDEETRQQIGSAMARATQKGNLGSSRMVLQIIDICKKQLRIGIDLSVGEFNRIKKETDLDSGDMYDALANCLTSFERRIEESIRKNARTSVGNIEPFEKNIVPLQEELSFALKHVKTGFLSPPEPPMPPTMANQISIGSMTGGAIQQGTTASTQNVTIKIDPQAVRDGIAGVENALKAETVKPETLAGIRADLDTIKAQLRKPEPSQSILVETGKSLRSVIEGAAAGAAAPQLTAAMLFLGRALGLA